VPSVSRLQMSPSQVRREFNDLVRGGVPLRVDGSGRQNPEHLLDRGYSPKHKLELFGTQFYLTNVRQNPELRFLVAYVVQQQSVGSRKKIFARIFYKDLSLVWRVASHFSNDDELWIGKGATHTVIEDGYEVETSQEATTDLPIEMQSAMETLLRWTRRPASDGEVIDRVVRRAPAGRIRPYADFLRPRRRAAANAANLINRGRSIAWFAGQNNPTSLRFAPGYKPDFGKGIVESSRSKSSLYHGLLKRFRILSVNREVQYAFIAGPKHVWIIPPQATTTELSSYGVRTVEPVADDDLFIPGYEYHWDDPEDEDWQQYSQIPPGFAGVECPSDPHKADASPWLDRIPIIQEFRRKVLKQS